MSTDPIKIAKSKIAFYEAEILKLKQFIEMAESLLEGEVASSRPTLKANDEGLAGSKEADVSTFREGASSRSAILKEAEDYLHQKGGPALASEIYDVITRRGIRISGQNPKGNLTAKFATAKDRFRYNRETGQWSLVEWLQEDWDDLLGQNKR